MSRNIETSGGTTNANQNATIAQSLKDYLTMKVTAQNAFDKPFIDSLRHVVAVEPFQAVGAMLDASAKIYGFRVDNTHTECYSVLKATSGDGKKRKNVETDEEEEERNDDDAEGDGENEKEAGRSDGDKAVEDKEGEKRERRRNKNIRHMVDNSDRGGKLSKKAHKLANDYKHIHKTLNEVSTTEELIDALENYKLSMNEIFNERRVGIPFVVDTEKLQTKLNRDKIEYRIERPIYQKISKGFSEGATQKFINSEVLSNDDGSFLILHTSWPNGEHKSIAEDQLSSELPISPANSLIYYDQLEKVMERALSEKPADLEILRYCCEDEEENIMKNIDSGHGQNMQDNHNSLTQLTNMEGVTQHRKTRAELFDELGLFNNAFFTPHETDDQSIPATGLSTAAGQMHRYLITRFAPLIDSVWHSIVKRATDTELARVGLIVNVGGRRPGSRFSNGTSVSRSGRVLTSTPVGQSQASTSSGISAASSSNARKRQGKTPNHLLSARKRFQPHTPSPRRKIGQAILSTPTNTEIEHYIYFLARPRQYPFVYLGQQIDESPMNIQQQLISEMDGLELDDIFKNANEITAARHAIEGANDTDIAIDINSISQNQENETTVNDVTLVPPTNQLDVDDDIQNDDGGGEPTPNDAAAAIMNDPHIENAPINDLTINGNEGHLTNIFDNCLPRKSLINGVFAIDGVLLADGQKSKQIVLFEEQVEVVDIETGDVVDNDVDEAFENDEALAILNLADNLENGAENLLVTDAELPHIIPPEEMEPVVQPIITDKSHWKGDEPAARQEETTQTSLKKGRKREKNEKNKGEDEGLTVRKRKRFNHPTLFRGRGEQDNMCWEPSGSNQCHLLCAFDETRVQRTRSVPAQNNFMTSLPPKEPRPSSSQYSNPNAFDPLELLRLRLFNKNRLGFRALACSLTGGRTTRFIQHKENITCLLSDLNLRKQITDFQNAFFSLVQTSIDYDDDDQFDPIEVDPEYAAQTGLNRRNSRSHQLFNDESTENGYHSVSYRRSMHHPTLEEEEEQEEEELQFYGKMMNLRQIKIKAPLVKRAIINVLSSDEYDARSLEKISTNALSISEEENQVNNNDASSQSSSNESISSDDEHEDEFETIRATERTSQGSTHTQAARRQSASNISMKGEHTNRDLLAFMPQFLYGQTKRDLNVVNAFAITLHLCNEKKLTLSQKTDPTTGLVTNEGMKTFRIMPSF